MTTGRLKPVVGDMAKSIVGLTNMGVSHISHDWSVFLLNLSYRANFNNTSTMLISQFPNSLVASTFDIF